MIVQTQQQKGEVRVVILKDGAKGFGLDGRSIRGASSNTSFHLCFVTSLSVVQYLK